MHIFASKLNDMKREVTLAAFMVCLAMAAFAEKKGPVLTFEKTDHNFGIFDQEHGNVSTYFRFTNTGDENLVLTDVYASCSCTVPEYPKHEIAPGVTDSIKVSYDGTTRRPGVFRKVVTINYNSKDKDNTFARVTITGEMAEKKVVEQLTKELDEEYKGKE